MKAPDVKITMDKHLANSHVYINGVEIPVYNIEILPLNGDNPIVKARLEVMVNDIDIKLDPEAVEYIKYMLQSEDVLDRCKCARELNPDCLNCANGDHNEHCLL